MNQEVGRQESIVTYFLYRNDKYYDLTNVLYKHSCNDKNYRHIICTSHIAHIISHCTSPSKKVYIVYGRISYKYVSDGEFSKS